jgi:hypothetical protein
MRKGKVAALTIALLACGCDDDESRTYTLYRNSPTGPLRVHFATFDADEKESYNRGNCELAADLLNRQANPGIKWWCEKGRYRP